MRKSWLVVCLLNFVIAATMGLLLRYAKIFPVAFDYQYLIHAHSHSAMFGWAYLMLFSFIVDYFVPVDKRKRYNTLFWLTQSTVVGMMITFPIQGYGLFSILFSSLHILCSYIFCFWIWNDNIATSQPAQKLLRAALVLMVLASIGAWSLGIIASIVGKQSALYKSAIQFFLHFQFNGWLIFAVLAVFFTLLRRLGAVINEARFRMFYYLFLVSVGCTLALPLSWFYSWRALHFINLAGLAFQTAALIMFLAIVIPTIRIKTHSGTLSMKWLLSLAMISFTIKMLVQVATAWPELAIASHTIRNFTIGFIHLTSLGVITGFLFFFLSQSEFINNKNKFWKSGILLFYIGFLFTEVMLFFQGMLNYFKIGFLEWFNEILFVSSVLLPVGLLLILLSTVQRKQIN